jgi:peptidoglycan/LPS O-acetylase OafA/YrhL
MQSFNSALVQKERLLPGIHGLRGVAALAVVLFHLIHIGEIKPPSLFSFIGRDFGYSVPLFFIVSAFSLMYSTEQRVNAHNWLITYFIKRFFRIAPLFYLILFFLFVFGLTGDNNIAKTILNITFTFGFMPSSGMVWGGWSVGVEMIFYVVFPILLLLIKTLRSAFIFLVISTVISYASYHVLHLEYLNTKPLPLYDWSYFSFSSCLWFFSLGIFTYLFVKSHKARTKSLMVYMPYLATVIISGLLFSNIGEFLHKFERLDVLFWGVGLATLCIWQAHKPSLAIGNIFLEWVGERSYSIYLIHPVIIYFSKSYIIMVYEKSLPVVGEYAYFICAGILITIIFLAAQLTYRLIEVPGINLGRKLIAWKKEALVLEASA